MTYNIYTCVLNFDNAETLYQTTGFSIAEYICEIWSNLNTKMVCEGSEFTFELPALFTDRDCDGGAFDIFANVRTDKTKMDKISKSEVNEFAANLIKALESELSKVIIPIDNLEDVIFDKKSDGFYVKMGCKQPNTLALSCTLGD